MKKKIVDLEKESFRAELGTSVYVITATCLLRFGIGTVALAGATLLYEGKLDVLTFSNVRFSYEEGGYFQISALQQNRVKLQH